jgi:uncharacterized protein (DUF736 family)
MAFDKSKTANGAMFINNRKAQDSHPDYQGSIEITPEFLEVIKQHMTAEGCKLDLAGWRKTSKGGMDYVSLSVKEPFEKKGGSSNGQSRPTGRVPF